MDLEAKQAERDHEIARDKVKAFLRQQWELVARDFLNAEAAAPVLAETEAEKLEARADAFLDLVFDDARKLEDGPRQILTGDGYWKEALELAKEVVEAT